MKQEAAKTSTLNFISHTQPLVLATLFSCLLWYLRLYLFFPFFVSAFRWFVSHHGLTKTDQLKFICKYTSVHNGEKIKKKKEIHPVFYSWVFFTLSLSVFGRSLFGSMSHYNDVQSNPHRSRLWVHTPRRTFNPLAFTPWPTSCTG